MIADELLRVKEPVPTDTYPAYLAGAEDLRQLLVRGEEAARAYLRREGDLRGMFGDGVDAALLAGRRLGTVEVLCAIDQIINRGCPSGHILRGGRALVQKRGRRHG